MFYEKQDYIFNNINNNKKYFINLQIMKIETIIIFKYLIDRWIMLEDNFETINCTTAQAHTYTTIKVKHMEYTSKVCREMSMIL